MSGYAHFELNNVTNPFDGTLIATDFKSDSVNSLNELDIVISSVGLLAQNNASNIGVLEQKTQHVSSNNSSTDFAQSIVVNGVVQADSVRVDAVFASSNANVRIDMAQNAVNVLAPSFQHNGNQLASVVEVIDLIDDAIAQLPAVTLTSAGGTETIVVDGTGPSLSVKGVTPGPGIVVNSGLSAIEIQVDPFALGLIDAVELKTQNIVAGTGAGDTAIVGAVSVVTVLETLTPATPTVFQSNAVLFLFAGRTIGGSWSLAAPLFITAVAIPAVHWPINSDQNPRSFKIYAEGNTTALYEYLVPRTNLIGSDFVFILPQPIRLPAGAYRHGVNSLAQHRFQFNDFSINMTFDPRIGNPQPAQNTQGIDNYPNTSEVTPNAIWNTGNLYIADFLPATGSLTVDGTRIVPVALPRTLTDVNRLALVDPLYSDEFIALGWLSVGNIVEWVLKAMPPAGGTGYTAVCLYNGGANFFRTRTIDQFNTVIDLSPSNAKLTGAGEILTVTIYPQADDALVCPRYHATFVRTASDIVLTVERFNPPM